MNNLWKELFSKFKIHTTTPPYNPSSKSSLYTIQEKTKLVSLDVLKLSRGEDVVRQNPEDIDPDRYADDGELTEIPEIPLVELERVHMEPGTNVVNPEIPIEVYPEPVLQDPRDDRY